MQSSPKSVYGPFVCFPFWKRRLSYLHLIHIFSELLRKDQYPLLAWITAQFSKPQAYVCIPTFIGLYSTTKVFILLHSQICIQPPVHTYSMLCRFLHNWTFVSVSEHTHVCIWPHMDQYLTTDMDALVYAYAYVFDVITHLPISVHTQGYIFPFTALYLTIMNSGRSWFNKSFMWQGVMSLSNNQYIACLLRRVQNDFRYMNDALAGIDRRESPLGLASFSV